MSGPPPIPNPRHTSGGGDPRRPYVIRNLDGSGKVIAPFFNDEEMLAILHVLNGTTPSKAQGHD